MEILYLKEIDSTHIYIKNYILQNGYKKALLVYTKNQTNGIGSRDNNWKGKDGNLFFSFVVNKEETSFDLPIQSYSIYFSYILKMVLAEFNSKVWIKWPNDFYINDQKIGGTITNLKGNLIFCGIGLNLKPVSSEFKGCLDVNVDVEALFKAYVIKLKENISWKQLFSKYLLEFELSKEFNTTIDDTKISLRDSILNNDGSIQIGSRRVFNTR